MEQIYEMAEDDSIRDSNRQVDEAFCDLENDTEQNFELDRIDSPVKIKQN